ncbi:MAG: hypothetical protein JXB05_28725 [Myxococcaceae bacterium]|nr:hypothetical protein [Myxococcaceae bacterium]
MRVTTPSPAVLARPTETQSPAANRTAQLVGGDKCGTPHGIVRGGCLPPPQLPTPPLPFPSKPSPVDARTRATQGDQLHQIADGVRNGSLTEKEAETLLKEQQAISNAQRDAMADGKLTLGERLKLGMMQARADHNIDRLQNNFSRDTFALLDADAQRQAGQIDQIANGRTNGNITNYEAGKLLGQQASIADSRDNSGPFSNFVTDFKQDQAQNDIARHSKPGTQFDFHPLPFPGPRPLPRPFPLPEPLPLPRLPRPELPKVELPVFRTNHFIA